MKYKEFYDGFRDNITGNEFKELMKPLRVVAELLDLKKNFSSEISSYKFYREFIESIVEQINTYKPITEKQKITIYFIKKNIEDNKALLAARRDARFYSSNDTDDSDYSYTLDREYIHEDHECNGSCGGCRHYGTCDLGDSLEYDRENRGGI